MIPFNSLGFFFHHFSAYIYPKRAKTILENKLSALPPNAKVLDVGGGTGVLSRFAYQKRPDIKYLCIDPSPGMMHYAPTYLELHEGYIEALPFDEHSFDMLMMGESLHHFSEHEKAFKEMKRVLKPGGGFYIFDFDPNHRRGKLVQKAEAFLGEPALFVSPVELQENLKVHGFESHAESMGWKYVLTGYKQE